ncbi:MAG TPA: dephospho-CoA kinase [Saprospiraceae bacterium]
MMNLIGLTGGIGSGKSTVAALFRTLGIPVYESDNRAKELMHSDDQLRQKITSLFGPEAYTSDRVLNRKWIASLVFNDQALLEKLNGIVHPAVYEDLKQWASEETQKKAPYLIQESAILFEENLSNRMKSVILVVADEEIRINRVIQRDNVSREHVLDRMKNQWPDVEKIPLSDYVIYNDGERSLIDQVKDIDQMIRSRL